MTEKELHRLRRQDLLQLLLEQSREVQRLQEQVDGLESRGKELDGLAEQLKERLDKKEAQIEKLELRLDRKEEEIRDLKEGRVFEAPGETGGIVSAPVRIEELFHVARRAAEAYLREKARTGPSAEDPGKDEA